MLGIPTFWPLDVVSCDFVNENENEQDDFDRDITGDNFQNLPLRFVFAELHETFISMLEVGFTEVQALRFLAFCSIYQGDVE